MIYASHFDRDYLEIEQKKKAVETKIELALKDTDFVLAKVLSEELEELIKLLLMGKRALFSFSGPTSSNLRR